jgi:hypothetical protein
LDFWAVSLFTTLFFAGKASAGAGLLRIYPLFDLGYFCGLRRFLQHFLRQQS